MSIEVTALHYFYHGVYLAYTCNAQFSLLYQTFIFVSPERDYVITDSVRSIYIVCM